MNLILRSCIILGLLCSTAFTAVAQSSEARDLIQKADKQYDLYAYNLALRTYEQVLKIDKTNVHAIGRIADCLFQLNKPEESLEWYQRATARDTIEREIHLRYGKALMHTGDYLGAKKAFVLFSLENPAVGKHYAEMCDYALRTAPKEAAYTAKNEALNTEAADYGPAFLGNRLVYNSARTDLVRKVQSRTISDWSGSAFNQLFVTQRSPDNGFLLKPGFLRNDLQNSYNVGPLSYSSDGRRVIFCKNNFIDGTRQIADRGLNMSLYSADVEDDGSWTNERALPFNGSDYSTGFPCLLPDGKTLFFASNQPNGFGGWDIYMTVWNGTEWSTPRNLGAPLNTPGNEITPFSDGQSFYFASDWHPGLGGMDIFRAEFQGEKALNIYHLGPGINSYRDDYGLVFNASQNLGYLTSNRSEGRGNEDVWQVSKRNSELSANTVPAAKTISFPTSAAGKGPQANNSNELIRPETYSAPTSSTPQTIQPTSSNESQALTGFYLLVTNIGGEPIANAELDLTNCGLTLARTDAEGKYYFSARERPLDCAIGIRAPGYVETVAPVMAFGQSNIVVQLAPETRKDFKGQVIDAGSRAPLSNVQVQYQLTASGRIFETYTDEAGLYSLPLVPRSSYSISYSKPGYADAVANVRPGMPGTGASLPPVGLERVSTKTAKNAASRTSELVAPVTYSTSTPPGTTQKTGTGLTGHAIQLASSPNPLTQPEIRQYDPLLKYGNVYSVTENNRHKVRLGIYPTRQEAEKNLKEVRKNKSYREAFVVEQENADPSQMITMPVATSLAQSGSKTTAAKNVEMFKPAEYSAPTVVIPAPTSTGGSNDARFAVQIASFSQSNVLSISDYVNLAPIGHVYAKTENSSTKVRVGLWQEYSLAESARDELVKRGYRDAMIVAEPADDPELQDIVSKAPVIVAKTASPKGQATSKPNSTEVRPLQYSTSTSYTPTFSSPASKTAGSLFYIRALTLDDVSNFDASKLKGIKGNIEQWPVANSTRVAIVLSGYKTSEEAIEDNEKLHGLGYPDSYILRDENGKLKRFKY